MTTTNLTFQELALAHVCGKGFIAMLAIDQSPRLVDSEEAARLWASGVPVFRLQAVEQPSDITGDLDDDDTDDDKAERGEKF